MNDGLKFDVRIVFLSALLAGVMSSAAATLYVDAHNPNPPVPYEGFSGWSTAATNIQEAVNEAEPGDVILVRAGRYTRPADAVDYFDAVNVVYLNKPLVIRGVDGREVTFIDGEGAYRCLALHHAVSDPVTVLEGFTLTNGFASLGGGIVHGAAATVEYRDNAFVANRALNDGGALYQSTRSTVVDITGCLFLENSVENEGGMGGAIRYYDSNLTISDSRFIANRAAADNSEGGAIWVRGAATIESTVFVDNVAALTGGAGSGGGALFNNRGDIYVRNSLMAGNYGRNGGAVYMYRAARLTLENCVLVDNTAAGVNGIRIRHPSEFRRLHIINSILDNDGSNVTNVEAAHQDPPPNVILKHSHITPDTLFDDIIMDFYGLSNIITAPVYVDRVAGNYRLTFDSPGINAGTNLPGLLDYDLDGNPRIIDGWVDMGCYEHPFFDLTVDPDQMANFLFADNSSSELSLRLGAQGVFPADAHVALEIEESADWMYLDAYHETLAPNTTNTVVVHNVAPAAGPGRHHGGLRIAVTNAGIRKYDRIWSNEVAVVLDVNDMSVMPGGLTNSTVAGADAGPLSFDLISGGMGQYTYAIATNTPGAWLQLSDGSGIMTDAMTDTITVNFAGSGNLDAGVHTNLLWIISTAGGGATQTVAVVMNVNPLRTLPSTTLTNVALQGINALAKSIKVYNTGAGAYNYTLTPTASWIDIAPSSGAVGAGTNEHTVHYITAGLAPGEHVAGIRLVSHDHGGLTQEVAAALTVLSQPELAVTPLYMEQSVDKGGQPANLTFNLWNAGFDPRVRMDYTLTSDAPWIKPFDPGYVTDATNAVAVEFTDMTGYASGAYAGHLTVVGRDAGSGYLPVGSIVMTSRLEVVVNILLDAPAWISAGSGAELDRVTVRWVAIDAHGTVNYEVWRGITRFFDEQWTERIAGAVEDTRYHDYTAAPGQLHYYWVRPVNDLGPGRLSDYDSGYRGLGAPGNLRASTGTYRDRVRVSWAGVDGAQAYEVWVRGSQQASPSSLVSGPLSQAQVRGPWSLVPGRAEGACVHACVGGKNQDPETTDQGPRTGRVSWDFENAGMGTGEGRGGSDLGCAATGTCSPAPLQRHMTGRVSWDFENAGMGMGDGRGGSELGCAAAGSDAHCGSVEPACLSACVHAQAGPQAGLAPRLQDWALLATTGSETIDHRSADENVAYVYKVRAVRHGDYIDPGAFSDPAVGYVLSSPVDLRAGQGTHVDRIPLTWTGMGGGQYEIWREGNVGYVLIGTSATRDYEDTDVIPGERHRYKVRARNADGVTGYSNMAEGYAAAAWVDLAVRQPVVLPKIISATALRTSSETGVGAPRLQALLEGRYAPRTEIAAHSAPPTRNPDVSHSSLANPSVSRVVSLRLYHNGGAPLTGDNAALRVVYVGSNRTSGITYDLGAVTTSAELSSGQSTVLTLPGDSLLWPDDPGEYDVMVEVMPVWPSLLAESHPADNTADVAGAVRVQRVNVGTGYWGFNDFSGDGISDLVMYKDGRWYARTVDGRVLAWAVPFPSGGRSGYRPVYGLDFDGDNRAEPLVYFGSTGRWQGMLSASAYRHGGLKLGGPSLVPAPGDYTGNGLANAAVYDMADGRWFVMDDAFEPLIWGEVFGAEGAVPVGGDYTGDGRWNVTVYHENTGTWYSRDIDGALIMWGKTWGGPGYVPVMGDYTGDGIYDLALYHEDSGHWYIRDIRGQTIVRGLWWGGPGFVPVPGDYDGDGVWDLALYNMHTGEWHIRSLHRGMLLRGSVWGVSGRLPVR